MKITILIFQSVLFWGLLLLVLVSVLRQCLLQPTLALNSLSGWGRLWAPSLPAPIFQLVDAFRLTCFHVKSITCNTSSVFCDFIVRKSIIFFSVEHCGYFQSCAVRNNTKWNLFLEMSHPPLHSPVLGQALSDWTASPELWEIFWRTCLLMAIRWFAVDSWKPKWEVGKRQGWQASRYDPARAFCALLQSGFTLQNMLPLEQDVWDRQC